MYYLAIARFHIDTFGALPCIIPQVQLGQSDVNLTIYSVTYKYKTYEYQQFLEFVTQDQSAPTPNAPTVQQDTSSTYYFVDSYSYFVSLINQTFSDGFTAFKALVEDGSDTLPCDNAPFLQYDSTSGEIIANADVTGYDPNLSNPIQIYFNTAMYNLLSSFEFIKMGFGANITNGKNFKLNVRNDNSANILEVSNTYSVYQCYQEYPSISTWSPVSRIIFTSSNLPMNPSIVSAPRVFNSIQGMNSSTSQTTTLNVITDMEINISNGKEVYPSVVYLPYQYRLVDLCTRTQLNEFSIECYWADKYGNIRPFNLPSGCGCDMKLVFIRKAFYN
ncbi:MAG: hypothetical protein EBQ92_10285 [Proteobacteria bacterium]|nr:hypothetical protein [Pseudomonadota bacterium]